MPIHDQGYRRYGGKRTPPGRAWAVIVKAGVRTFLSRRAFLGLLLLAWFPCFVRAMQFYAFTSLPQAAFLRPTPETFRQFIAQQGMFVFFVTVYAGAGLIADDRRANALQIYLSKPLSRVEYIFGKMAILMTFLLLVTWAPATILLLLQVALAGNVAFLRENLFLFPAITAFSLLEAVMIASVMLALSSFSKSRRYVAILYAAIVFFTRGFSGVLGAVTGDDSLSWISFSFNLEQVGDAIFGIPARDHASWPISLLAIVLLVGAAAVVLERRVRGVEVVA